MKCCDPQEGPRGSFECWDEFHSFETCCSAVDAPPAVVDGRDSNMLRNVAFDVEIEFEKHLNEVGYMTHASKWEEVESEIRENSSSCGDFEAAALMDGDAAYEQDLKFDRQRLEKWSKEIYEWSVSSLDEPQKLWPAQDIYMARRSCQHEQAWYTAVPIDQSNSTMDGPRFMFEAGYFCFNNGAEFLPGSCCLDKKLFHSIAERRPLRLAHFNAPCVAQSHAQRTSTAVLYGTWDLVNIHNADEWQADGVQEKNPRHDFRVLRDAKFLKK